MEVAEAVIKSMETNEYEIVVGPSKTFVNGSKSEKDMAFERMNQW